LQKKVALNTLSGLQLFSDEIKGMCIFNIPHTSIRVPSNYDYLNNNWQSDITWLTDWDVDKIFSVKGIEQMKATFSRVWCDVERLNDADEPMFKKGQGFYYTHNDFNEEYRNDRYKNIVYADYYIPYHNEMTKKVMKRIKKYGSAIIIDGHSFNSITGPDICIGTDDYHTPQTLVDQFKLAFESFGYSIRINDPYSGSFVPINLYKKEERVNSILIEINKKLYMDDVVTSNNKKIKKLKKQISSIFDFRNNDE